MLHARSPIARTPLHHWHTAHGGRFIERDGWQVVAAYTSAEQEAEAARSGVGLADVSADTKIRLHGPGVSTLVHLLIAGGAAPTPRSVVCFLDGQALACQLTGDHLLLLARPSASTPLMQQLAGLIQDHPLVQTDATSACAGFWLIGPRCDDLLRSLTPCDVGPQSLPVNGCAETSLAGVEALLVRTAELSVPSLRIYIPSDLGEYVWERMLQAGREVNLSPLGMEALALLGAAAGRGAP
jgi:sarcosine oxidase subunit alpha